MAVQLIVQVAAPPLSLIEEVARAAPVTFLLRGHGASGRALYERAGAVMAAAGRERVTLSDRVDVALALGLESVQLSASSVPAPAVRRYFRGRLGRSVHSVAEGLAVQEGVDYLVLGAIWPTPSHPGRPAAGLEALARLCSSAGVPVWAVGGITPERCRKVRAAGAGGAIVSSAVWSAKDPPAAAQAFFAKGAWA